MAWSRVLTFDDPLPYQSAIRAADVDVYPTERGGFHSELTQIVLNQLWMQRFDEKLPRVFTSGLRPGRTVVAFLAHENQPAMRHCGMDVSPLDLIVIGHDEIHQRTKAGSHCAAMGLPTDDFYAAYKALVGRELMSSPFTHLIRSNHALMSGLIELHKTAAQMAKTTPSLFELPEVVRNLEQKLIHAMISCLAEGAPLQMSVRARRSDAIVGRLEEFLEANPDRPLYLVEICGAIGVPERTLRFACEEHLGMGPIRFLSLRRMHLVRRALLLADCRSTTVTRLATDYGFWELGRFAVAYRALFGESPSATLQRPPSELLMALNRPTSLENSEFA
ncbi:helix-turn-helix domain-containing protein [Bradyrhizobium sp. AUGA SZCCT0431]|uniref:helix-turn-helix domain-containing protein n=1 Tax=Bradyrhizobium sp. AUGA SZCCT0431 TaxID=2807674 RepID=UPI001BAE0796|nr:helix-turn-helix domain-containing protein [Bradyrhizobium sp. AUGA SZCCT0431]MBR1148996.1 helix-turn-helix domain-containing protein [Bradyrhizobium sp. AUGA SZCCT0431]